MNTEDRQLRTLNWALAAFPEAEVRSLPQRGLRLAEEAIEAAQSCGTPQAKLHELIDIVYSRPSGKLSQELGGVGVTALVLAAIAGLDLEDCIDCEVFRVLAKPLADFKRRNAEKNAMGLNVTKEG